MNKRFLSVIIFAFVISAGASLLIYRAVSAHIGQGAAQATVAVVGAARDLPLGTLIKDEDVTLVQVTGAPPAHALKDKADVIGRGVVATVFAGEPILETRLAPKGAGAGMAATIPAGMRAVAVRVNDVVGVAGFVVPGMRVDVLISGMPPGDNSRSRGTLTRTLLQNIQVLSAGQNIQKDTEGKPVSVPVVNLLVTPEQAETLSLASNETRIQLVLRNPLDVKEEKTPGTAMARLFGSEMPAPRPAVAAAPRPRPVAPPKAVEPPPAPPAKVVVPIVIEVLHGNKSFEAKFERKTEEN